MYKTFTISIILISLLLGCADSKLNEEEFYKSHEEWRTKRLERLKSKNGWLNLAGLFWLEEGENTFGSDSSNNIIFPAA